MCANLPQVRPWTFTKSSASLTALWTKEVRQGEKPKRWGVFAHCLLFFCLGSGVSSTSCDSVVWKGKRNRHLNPTLQKRRERKTMALNVWGKTGVLELWDYTHLLSVILLLQGCVKSVSVDAEISGGAQLHVLHQIYLDNHQC